MGLNLSNRQIALELGLSPSDVQAMTEQLRHGLIAKTPAMELEGDAEVDEVYVVAGHIGHKRAYGGWLSSTLALSEDVKPRRTSAPPDAGAGALDFPRLVRGHAKTDSRLAIGSGWPPPLPTAPA